MARSIVRRTARSPAVELSPWPLLNRIYAGRNVGTPTELLNELRHLSPPSVLRNIDQAVDLLHTALRERWRIIDAITDHHGSPA